MYARNVTLHLKANKAAEFTRTLEIAFLATEGNEVLAISLWEKKENAEAYGRDTYAAVLRTLEPVVEGTPEVDSYEVSNSTFHKIASQNQNQSQPVTR